MIVGGIDPGLTGAAAFIGAGGRVAIEDLPTMPLPGNGLVTRKIDGHALAQLLRKHVGADEVAQVFLEQVGTMGGRNNAVQTQGSLLRTLGAIESVLEVLRMPPKMLQPQKWKSFYGLNADKRKGMNCALRLYPAAPITLAKHHNRAEALLIAHYGLRHTA